MNTMEDVLERVRRADPVDAAEVASWSRSDHARNIVDSITGAPAGVPLRQRNRRTRRLVLTAVVVTGGLTTAAAASGILGGAAPDRVREHLASLDKGMPPDLRLNPDVEHARAVAATTSGALYAADLTRGGYCLEVATGSDQPRGAVCVTAADAGHRAVEVTAPIPSGPDSALLVGGRINDPDVTHLAVRFSDGRTTPVVLGLDRYWLFEVPGDHRDDALTNGVVVAALAADGRDVFTQAVPPLGDDDPTGTRLDGAQPIFVSTISTGDDLTKVLGVEGSVNASGATTLELRYPDGTTQPIPIDPGGRYRFMLPADRQDDFATSAGRLIARDAAGTIVATASVSSVANSRRTG